MTRDDIIAHANAIRIDYARQGLKLTLRQMYYQFVSRGLCANGQKEYKRIGAALVAARMSGTFPMDGLEDRGRDIGSGDWFTNDDSVEQALRNGGYACNSFPKWYLNRSSWWGQPTLVSVWVEKEALAGVFERECRNLGVPLFPCKGYPSLSALWSWHKQVRLARDLYQREGYDAPEAVILYFGDHDPDGFQIPRSALATLLEMQDLDRYFFPLELERISLNIEQVRRYSPPPFAAKMSSSRYASYIQEHGIRDAWELDALEPRVLQRLIRDSVAPHFDENIFEDNEAAIEALRDEMREHPQFVKARDILLNI